MNASERDRLIDDLLDGEISEADFLRLEAEMIVNEETRNAYYQRQMLQTGLAMEAEEAFRSGSGARRSPAWSGGRARSRFDWILATGMVLAALLVGLIGWKLGQDSRAGAIAVEKRVSGFGVVARELNAVWEEGIALGEGDLLPPGTLELVSGTVQLELFNGVDLILSGKGRIEIRSDHDFHLERGKATFRVPAELEGLRVGMPSGVVVGKGAEFAVEVSSGSESVSVLSGTVGWEQSSGDSNRIEAGRGLKRTAEGTLAEVANEGPSFTEMEQVFLDATAQRKERWEKRLAELSRDSRVIVLYSMTEVGPGGSLLKDLSRNGADGDIIRSARAADRWGEPFGSLDFTPTGSRVRVNLEGEFSSLTLACWVKIDSLDRVYNSLFLTDGHERFEPHWQIMSDGRIFFSVKAHEDGVGKDKHIAYSPSIWSAARSGQWMHLATVFDGAEQTITHYVNGAAVSTDAIPADLAVEKVRIGAASIGNWSEPRYRSSPEFAVRNLNGTMDELILFSSPLEGREILELYQFGKP